MRNVFALFGFFTALNTLVMVAWIYLAFDMDRTEWLEHGRDFYLDLHQATYIYLGLALLIEALIWAYKKWKSRYA